MDYIRLSLAVSWRFINLDYAFSNVFDHSSPPAIRVLGCRYKQHAGRSDHGFYSRDRLPTRRSYIPLQKETLDILQVQVGEETGQ